MSIGGGKSYSQNESSNEAFQKVLKEQIPYFESLWGSGQELASDTPGLDQASAYTDQYAQQTLPQIYDPLLSSYTSTFGTTNPYAEATSGLLNPLVSGLTNILSSPGVTFAEGGVNPLLDANVAMAMEQASQNFNRNVLPSIGRDAELVGQAGGTRQQVGEALALDDYNRSAQQMAAQMYGDQYSSDRAANLMSQQQADATRMAAAQQIQDLMAGQVGSFSQGADTASTLANIMGAPYDMYSNLSNIAWNPLMNYASIIGAPIVLGEASGDSSGFGTGSDFNFSLFRT